MYFTQKYARRQRDRTVFAAVPLFVAERDAL
jgi:hypothetical protein